MQMPEDIIMMFRLYVSPQHQRRGVGEFRLKNVSEHFPGAKKLRLDIEVMNSKGKSFCQKHGFEEIEREKVKIGDEVMEVIWMEKQLRTIKQKAPVK
jgi:GNAT superfamily N-acetyltransferase